MTYVPMIQIASNKRMQMFFQFTQLLDVETSELPPAGFELHMANYHKQ